MNSLFENNIKLQYFPKSGNIVSPFLIDKSIFIENIMLRDEYIRSSPDYLTKTSGGIWFTVVIDKEIFFEFNRNDMLRDYLKILNTIECIDQEIILPEHISILVIHSGDKNMFNYCDEQTREKYHEQFKAYVDYK